MDDCGVYILYSNEIPIYVGSSTQMRGRVKQHNHKGKFDSVKYFEFPEDQLSTEEQRFIDELKPILNQRPAVLTPVSRTTLYFTQEDKKTTDNLKRLLEPTYGVLTVTAIVRMALRALERQQ